MNEGRLVYVVGPSGAGKDSVIAKTRENIHKNNCLYFTHRYVTRHASEGDDDIAFTDAAFTHYQHLGMFALDWEAHGFRYGISVVINNQLRAGRTVVVNGSRAYLPTALGKYPGMTVVQITAPPPVARARLYARGRENAAAIAKRLDRTPSFTVPQSQLVTIDNSGSLEHAAQALASVLIGNGDQNCGSTRGSVASL